MDKWETQGKSVFNFAKNKQQKKGERKYIYSLQSSASQGAGMAYNFLPWVGE